jgi:hypothetical protein
MELHFAQKHAQSDLHTCHANNLRSCWTLNPHHIVEAKHWTGNHPKHESGVSVELKLFGLDFMDGDNCPMETDSLSTPILDLEIPLSNYLRDIVRNWSWSFKVDEHFTDLFADLQEKLTSGDIPFSTPLTPINKKYELCDYSASNFGIDIFGR